MVHREFPYYVIVVANARASNVNVTMITVRRRSNFRLQPCGAEPRGSRSDESSVDVRHPGPYNVSRKHAGAGIYAKHAQAAKSFEPTLNLTSLLSSSLPPHLLLFLFCRAEFRRASRAVPHPHPHQIQEVACLCIPHFIQCAAQRTTRRQTQDLV